MGYSFRLIYMHHATNRIPHGTRNRSIGQPEKIDPTTNRTIVERLFHGRKEGNVLFNDALNTFYLWRQTYGKGPIK